MLHLDEERLSLKAQREFTQPNPGFRYAKRKFEVTVFDLVTDEQIEFFNSNDEEEYQAFIEQYRDCSNSKGYYLKTKHGNFYPEHPFPSIYKPQPLE